MPARTESPVPLRPLLVTDDAELLDEVLRLAGQVGADIEVAPDPAAARDRYGTAPLVLVGVELADACARARLPRRPGVVLVALRSGPSGSDPPWALAERVAAEHVAVLPAAAPWLSDRFAMSARTLAPGRVITVVGGRGGAGASVLATALAVTATLAGRRTLLVDADRLGGGLDLVLGWEGIEGIRWPGLAHTDGPVSPAALVEALPRHGELAVLSCDRDDESTLSTAAMGAAIDAGRRGSDLVVVDLPRRFDEAAVNVLGEADHTLLVVPAELRACAAAARVAATVLLHTDTVSVVVRGPAPGKLKPREIAHALGLPLAGSVRSEPAVARGLERGEAPAGTGSGALAELCRGLLVDFGVTERAVAA
jgi:secretion/DNA translocation related CpaE-like protein